jgi:hypothetical protein
MDYKGYDNELLDLKRLSGDPDADNFIQHVFADPSRKKQLQLWLSENTGVNHLHTLKRLYPGYQFIQQADQLPPWADSRLMKTGATLFARNAETIMSLLGLLSLPYCYTAADGARVLYLSEMMRKQTAKRLLDTATFVWEVMDPDAFDTNDKAYTAILKVRLMHAAVRYYTVQNPEWNQDWGVPINQEDMAGTNLSFSLIVIRGLRLLGYPIDQPDRKAFMHLWAVVGYFTGLDQQLIPAHLKQASQLEKIIKKRQFQPSAHGHELTQSLTDHILLLNQSKASATDIKALMRYLLGQDVAAMLGIEAPNLPQYKLTLIQNHNFWKSFMNKEDSRVLYQQAYAAFKRQNPQPSKKTTKKSPTCKSKRTKEDYLHGR